ncbi:hypothetical protein [Eisenbergiella massiliensis]|uniref:hypothetical protein n=1 Tax=Eisenbergiella massiliensis TaxID=1720294 RepID=UPI0023EF9951|nr:hypothetical protein [Eisenbergiella massiliensis]
MILYRNGTQASIEKYMFMFQSFREAGQVAWYHWKEQDEVEDMMNALNIRTETHFEWRLIIFEGKSECCGGTPENTIPEKISTLISSYGHVRENGYTKIKGCCPQQIWYVGYRKKLSVVPCYKGGLISVDADRKYGSCFRMLWMEIDCSCEMLRQYSLFMLTCGLLTLAANQFPAGILEYGFLYKLTVEIEQNGFEKFIFHEEMRLAQILDDLNQEIESLRQKNLCGVDYPEAVSFKCSLNAYRNRKAHSEKFKKIRMKNFSQSEVLQDNLAHNRHVVWSKLYFPKGVLREEASRIQDEVSRRKKAGGFLSEAGKDMLEREKKEAFEQMSEKRQIQLQQQDFEWNFRNNEENIRQKMEYIVPQKQKKYLFVILCVIEVMILVPFVYSYIKYVNKLENLIIIIICCFLFLLVVTSFFLLEKIDVFSKVRKYNRHFTVNLEDRQEKKVVYLESILELISKYQYCTELEEEQEEQKMDSLQRRKRLMRHRFVCESSLIICRQLKYLLVDSNKSWQVKEPVLTVDFEQEPQDTEYYWIPYKRSLGMADINRSGSQVKVFFDFIPRIRIEKTEY